jgi:hypothetical protein
MNLDCSRQVCEKNQVSKLMKILSVGAALFHVDGWTDRERERDRQTMEDQVADFYNFWKEPKIRHSTRQWITKMVFVFNMAVILNRTEGLFLCGDGKTGCASVENCIDFRRRRGISSRKCPDRLWDVTGHLFTGHRGIFPRDSSGLMVSLAIQVRYSNWTVDFVKQFCDFFMWLIQRCYTKE